MRLLERQLAAEREHWEPTPSDDATGQIHGDVPAVREWQA